MENVLRILENLNFSHDIQKKILLKSAYNKKALEILSTNVQISDPFSKKIVSRSELTTKRRSSISPNQFSPLTHSVSKVPKINLIEITIYIFGPNIDFFKSGKNSKIIEFSRTNSSLKMCTFQFKKFKFFFWSKSRFLV